MARLWTGDFETGDESQYNGYTSALSHPGVFSGRTYSLAPSDGRKWSSQVAAQVWTARMPLNETVGTAANDTLGAHDGTYTGGVTLNQAGTVGEAGTASVLLDGVNDWIDLGANGFDLTTGSWGFFVLAKPSALGASHRGLFGGPAGSVCLSLLNGNPTVGVVGGDSIQLPSFSRPATLGIWNAIGVSYNAGLNEFTSHVYSSSINYQSVTNKTPGWAGGRFPTVGVKSNQVFRRDSGGYFAGNAQEVLFILGGECTQFMFLTLWEDALTRTADRSIIVNAPSSAAPTGGKGMTRVHTNPPLAGQYRDESQRYANITTELVGTTEYYTWMLRFPSVESYSGRGDANWTGNFFTSPLANAWYTWTQLSYEGLTAASIMLEANPTGDESVSGPSLRLRMQGGATIAGGTPEDRNAIDPLAGNGWNVHKPPGSYPGWTRWPQILGPNTFLNAGLHLFTLDVWHEFIIRFTWASTTFTGAIEVWHRVQGSGTSISAASSKVYEVFNRKTYQYQTGGSGLGGGTFSQVGAYFGRGALPLYHYYDQHTRNSTFADAEAALPPETIATIAIEQVAYRGRNDDGGQASATWKAAQNTPWVQQVGQNFRVRFEAQATGGTSGATGAVQYQYSKNGGPWTNVTDVSSVVRSSASPFAVEGDTTSDQLTAATGPFALGYVDEVNGLASSVTLGVNGQTEWEFCGALVAADVVANDSIRLRLTYANDTTPAYTQVATFTVLGSSPPVSDAYRDAVLATAGLRGYWRFSDQDTTLRDELGVLNGSYAGGYTQSQPGIPALANTAVDFNGASGYAEVPDNNLLDLGNGPFTIEWWVKRDGTGTVDGVLSKGVGAYELLIETDNTVRLRKRGTAGDIVTSSIAITDTTSYHYIVVTYNGGANVVLKIDNVDRTGTKNTQTLADTSSVLKVGALHP